MVILNTGTFKDVEIDQLRDQFEFEMEDECRIYRVTTEAELQPNGTKGSDTELNLYTGICSIAPIIARRDRFDEFGEGLIFSVQYRLTVPYDVTGVRITDRVVITLTRDPEMDTRNFEVRDIHRTTDLAQRRFTVHDIGR